MQNTVGDFWRMIWEYKVSCIAMLCQLQEKGVVSFVILYSREFDGAKD